MVALNISKGNKAVADWHKVQLPSSLRTLTSDQQVWIHENIVGEYFAGWINPYNVYFEQEEDAMLFKLVWCYNDED